MPQQNFRLPVMPLFKTIPGESDDERFERTTDQRRQQINAMLDKLDISQDERQFIIAAAERMVDLICADYSTARTAQAPGPRMHLSSSHRRDDNRI